MFHKILIANRGEIALRIIRTCREMGIRTVVAYSTADAALAARARWPTSRSASGRPRPRAELPQHPEHHLGRRRSPTARRSIPATGSSRRTPTFAEICRACGITFIGPSPEAIRLMGDKAQAREHGQAGGRAGGAGQRGAARRGGRGAGARRRRSAIR